jgi:hypothetical protein
MRDGRAKHASFAVAREALARKKASMFGKRKYHMELVPVRAWKKSQVSSLAFQVVLLDAAASNFTLQT